MSKIRIGIDQSLNSTGVTVIKDDEIQFFIITNHRVKKNINLPANLNIIYIYKEPLSDDKIENERIKYRNVRSVVDAIDQIIKPLIGDDIVLQLEGISYGSRNTRALDELCALNYFIRQLCELYNINYNVIPPSKVKKYATGIGNADKDVMLDAFCALFPIFTAFRSSIFDTLRSSNYSSLRGKIKLDDVADSYFIAVYQ